MGRRIGLAVAALVASLALPAGAKVPASAPDSVTFNLDCVIAITSEGVVRQEAGDDPEFANLTAMVLYFAGRFEGASDEDFGGALNKRALEDVDTDGLMLVCGRVMSEAVESLDRADEGMHQVERLTRERLGAR